MNDLRVSLVLRAIDNATAPLKRILGSIREVGSATARLNVVGSRVAALGADIVKFGGIAGGVGAAIGGAFTRSIIGTAAEFERFGAILETTEGSAEKARAALDWANQFANTTPYDIAEVTDAFVKLRSYGLDPTKGLLKSLGDTSAAFGKPLSQAVEAIADAVTGENERLKEFGITASKTGNKVTYEWTKNGKQFRKTVSADNRAAIQSTLEMIMKARSAGAMERLSKTWEGTLSNLRGHWTTFQQRVGDSGAFKLLKDEANGVLAVLDRMEKSGELKKLADIVGGELAKGLNAAGAGIRELIEASGGIESFASDVGSAMRTVGEAVGGVAKAVRAAAEAFDWLNQNVPGLDSFRQKGLNLDKPLFEAQEGGAAAWAMNKLGIGDSWLASRQSRAPAGDGTAKGAPTPGSEPTRSAASAAAPSAAPSAATVAGKPAAAPSAAAAAGRAQVARAEVGGKIVVAIESDQRARVKRVESRDVDFEMRLGPMAVMP